MSTSTTTARRAGLVAAAAATLVTGGFAVLAASFDFPDVLDRPAAEVLPLFTDNEATVAVTYALLALSGVLFAVLAVLVARLTPRAAGARAVAALGVAAGVAQAIGFARWPLLIPGIADDALTDPAGAYDRYDTLNGVLGGAIGETAGWLLQAAWGVGAALLLQRAGFLGRRTARVATGLAAAFGALTVVALAAPGAEAVLGPLYSAWVLLVGVVGGVAVQRSRRAARAAVA